MGSCMFCMSVPKLLLQEKEEILFGVQFTVYDTEVQLMPCL
jgi:hypothetical protein